MKFQDFIQWYNKIHFSHLSTSVRWNNRTKSRLGWTFSDIFCCIFVHPDLKLAPLLIGMQVRSITLYITKRHTHYGVVFTQVSKVIFCHSALVVFYIYRALRDWLNKLATLGHLSSKEEKPKLFMTCLFLDNLILIQRGKTKTIYDLLVPR